MSSISVKELRERTGAGILDCKKAIEYSKGDLAGALDYLKIKGITRSEDISKRTATEGIVYSYIHHTKKVGVLLELNCETDFVAMNSEFKELANSLCLHIAAAKPTYVSRETIPLFEEVKQREFNRRKALEEGKSDSVLDKIVDGRMNKFYKTVCLMEQEYVLDDSKTVEDVVREYIVKLGESIKVKQFSLFTIGEERDA